MYNEKKRNENNVRGRYERTCGDMYKIELCNGPKICPLHKYVGPKKCTRFSVANPCV